MSFEHKLFNLSTDYKKLWNLAKEGHRIPAWIIYTDEFEEPIYDMVEVKKGYMRESVDIGYRGRGYCGWDDSFEAFEAVCKQRELKFIDPCL